jgi:hypothetical protein
LRGDVNLDGHVNSADILALMNALSDLSGYQAAHFPTSPNLMLDLADVNGDNKVTDADLQGLLNLLKTGGGSADPVPEPSSVVLATLGILGLLVFVRRRKPILPLSTAVVPLGVAVLALALVLSQAQTVLAATKTWAAFSGNWSVNSNWLPSGVPAFGDSVSIVNGFSGRTVTYDGVISESDLFSLTINVTDAALSNTLSMPNNNTLKVSDREFIGGYAGSPAQGGSGTITQSNGTNNIGGAFGFSMYLGYNAADQGFYNLSGTGALISGLAEAIGYNGTGTFTQTGGANTVNTGLSIGGSLNSHGTYNLSNGTLFAGSELIGSGGTGLFSQSGGAQSVVQDLYIGASANSNGTYNLSGGTAAIGGGLYGVYVGGGHTVAGGTGVLTVSDSGDLTTTSLTVYNTAGSGVNLSGGAIHSAALNLNGSPARLNWTGGTLDLTTSVTFDSAAAGTTTSAAFGSSLALGSSQTLMIDGDETLGGTGSFDLTLNSGATHSVAGGITLNPTGTLTQNAGSTLTYSSFTQAGGAVNGTLQNPGNFVYQSGLFNGRLVNQGTVSFGSNFTVGDGIENDTTMTVAAGQTLTVNGAGLDNQGTFTLAGGTLAVNNMTNSGGFVFDSGTLTATEAGGTINAAIVSNTPNTINIAADNVSIGNAASFNGFNHQGVLNVGANTVTLNSAGFARLGIFTSLAGGTINAANGVSFATGSNFLGNGIVSARISGAAGSIIEANGALTLGDPASPAGFNFAGELHTKQFAITLNASGPAKLGSLTTIGDGANAGTLNAANGFVVDFGNAVTGYGTINSANVLAKRATINGTLQGNSVAQPIMLSGYIKGVGTFDNVVFTGTYSPGLSPTIATVGSIMLAPASTLIMELGGTTPGSSYDQIQASGALTLGGILNVSLINGFTPVSGTSFDLLDWGTLSGKFSGLQLPSLTGPMGWDTSKLYTTGLITATAYLPGDFNRDGHVNSADILPMEQALTNLSSYKATYAPGILDPQLALIDDVNGDGKFTNADLQKLLINLKNGGGSADPVPEPSTFVLAVLAFGTMWWRFRFNVGQSQRRLVPVAMPSTR